MEQRRKVSIKDGIDCSPGNLVKAIRGALQEFSPLLRQVKASERLRKKWDEDVKTIQSTNFPNTVIAFVGTSGAGKSSLINALLGVNIVATSGVRACTSVITSVSFHPKPTYEAKIPFVSKDDWGKEIHDLRRGLLESEQPDSPSPELAKEWDKISAVYPSLSKEQFTRMTVTEILASEPKLFEKLGTMESVLSKNAEDFADQIRPYVDPTMATQSQLWPVILEVRIRCNSRVLSSGATLVDLPGVSDSNAARDAVARDFLKRCHSVFIVAPISRAVTDKLAKDLCGEAFRQQLLYGNYDGHAITFIGSKTDDIDSKEIVKALRLERDNKIFSFDEEIRNLKQSLDEKKKQLKDLERELKGPKSFGLASGDHNTGTSLGKRSLSERSNSSKRRRIGSSSEAWRELQNEFQKMETHEASTSSTSSPSEDTQAQHTLSSKHHQSGYVKAKLENEIHTAKEQLKRLQRMKTAYCSQRRSEFAIAHIKEDFRRDIEETLKSLPSGLTHPPSSDLKVFACSAKEYMNLANGDEDEAFCFDNKQDTGIPGLRAWCHSITRPFLTKAANMQLEQFRALVDQVCSFINNQTEITSENRSSLKGKWASDSSNNISSVLNQNFADACTKQRNHLTEKFNNELSVACKRCALRAGTAAVDRLQRFYESEKPHHATFHALLTRHGAYGAANRKLDLNHILGQDFQKAITPTWTSIFASDDLFESLPNNIQGYIEDVVQLVRESAAPSLEGNIDRAEEQCLNEARRKIKEIKQILDSTISFGQRGASREFPVLLQKRLKTGYDLASAHTGKGRFLRQKETLKAFLENKKDEIFSGAADDLVAQLLREAETCDRRLARHLTDLANRIEVILSAVWENPRNIQEELTYRKVRLFDEKSRKLRPLSEEIAGGSEPMEI